MSSSVSNSNSFSDGSRSRSFSSSSSSSRSPSPEKKLPNSESVSLHFPVGMGGSVRGTSAEFHDNSTVNGKVLALSIEQTSIPNPAPTPRGNVPVSATSSASCCALFLIGAGAIVGITGFGILVTDSSSSDVQTAGVGLMVIGAVVAIFGCSMRDRRS